MRIAQICPYDFHRPGGVKNHIEGLASELRNMGHEVEIFVPGSDKEFEDSSIKSFGGFRSTSSRSTKIDFSLARWSEFRKMVSYIKSRKFDVIHYHNLWNPFLPWQILFTNLWNSTINITTFHDTPKDTSSGKYLVAPFFMPFGAMVISLYVSGAISVSNSQSNYIRKFFFRPLSIIPNGIDLGAIQTNPEPSEHIDENYFNCLFVGRLEPRKGLDFAINAYAQLKSRYPKLKLLVAGDGDDREEYQEYVEANNIQDVEFLGFVSEIEKHTLMQQADLLIAPSVFGESFGIVLLEAMACGIPMVGFGNEGYKNVIKDKWLEYFPKPRDAQQLTEKMEKMILNESIRNEMIDWGREEVLKYDWKIISKNIAEVYASLGAR